jgi:hypothetical protein
MRHPRSARPARREKQRRRLARQFRALERAAPPRLRPAIRAAQGSGGSLIRTPAGLLLVAGGVFSFLPVLGLWMLPAGLLLLAIDLPPLRGPVSAAIIRVRRRWKTRRRQGR